MTKKKDNAEQEQRPEIKQGEGRIVSKQATEPCGCVITEYVNAPGTVKPCVPHALDRAAKAMARSAQAQMEAAQSLGAVAERIVEENNQRMLAEIDKATKEAKAP